VRALVRGGVSSVAARSARTSASVPPQAKFVLWLWVASVRGVLAPTVHSSGQAGHAAIFLLIHGRPAA
jgi:hypothetical protein